MIRRQRAWCVQTQKQKPPSLELCLPLSLDHTVDSRGGSAGDKHARAGVALSLTPPFSLVPANARDDGRARGAGRRALAAACVCRGGRAQPGQVAALPVKGEREMERAIGGAQRRRRAAGRGRALSLPSTPLLAFFRKTQRWVAQGVMADVAELSPGRNLGVGRSCRRGFRTCIVLKARGQGARRAAPAATPCGRGARSSSCVRPRQTTQRRRPERVTTSLWTRSPERKREVGGRR